ncbi:MAG: hypothetical protein HZA51_01675 [Planctomycetes bacterium]|nr:hypothetical protein [Planctomycetota bacterium]
MIFNYDWWFGSAYPTRLDEAKLRCTRAHYPTVSPEAAETDSAFQKFFKEVEARTILYLRDGFSYEVKEIIPLETTNALSFECMPTDDAYKVGAFVVTIPFDDIIRVEIFAVHPKEKPEDMPAIKGFSIPGPHGKRPDERPQRSDAAE